MRTRGGIMNDKVVKKFEDNSSYRPATDAERVMIEILLDIRELLSDSAAKGSE